MMRISGRLGLVGVAVGLLSSSALSQQVPTIFMQIVEHNGNPIPNATALLAAPGDEIVIDIMAKEWSPTGEKARSYQVNLDSDSLVNDLRGTVAPKTGPRPCSVSAQCSDISSLSVCTGGFCTPVQPDMAGVLVDQNRASWIFFGKGNIGGPSALGGVTFGYALTNPGQSLLYISPKYLGTFTLVVSADACGQFHINSELFPDSALFAAGDSEAIASVTGRNCSTDADCSATEVCITNSDFPGKVCSTARTEGVTIRTGDCACRGIAIDDAEAFVVDPPSCAIDARQRSNPDGTNAAGYSSMQVKLDCEDAAGIVQMHKTNPIFTLREVPGNDGTPNSVANVTANDPAPGWVTVHFANPVTEEAWTCVNVRIGTNVDSACVGSLPGDSNADRVSDTLDIQAVTSCAVNSSGCDLRLCDIDRSGSCTPTDILRSIDLLNGGDLLGPSDPLGPVGWDGAGLLPCPEIR